MADSHATRISDCPAWFPVAVKMPGSSPLEELTAAVEVVKRILATLATDVDPTGRQPLQEAKAITARGPPALSTNFTHCTRSEGGTTAKHMATWTTSTTTTTNTNYSLYSSCY